MSGVRDSCAGPGAAPGSCGFSAVSPRSALRRGWGRVSRAEPNKGVCSTGAVARHLCLFPESEYNRYDGRLSEVSELQLYLQKPEL